jgi:alkaline phosphatase D
MTIRIPRNKLGRLSRRRFLSTAAATALGSVAMPYLSRAADRPQITHGVQSGDVGSDGGVVWARVDRPSQMLVEVASSESFKNATALPPIAALPESDFTAKMLLENLPSGQDIFYRVRFRDLLHTSVVSEPAIGRFRTAPGDRRDVSFVWGGDVAGQGWGINPDDGGMFTFATCASTGRISCCIRATASMPMASFPPRLSWLTEKSGKTSRFRKKPRSPRRSMNSAAHKYNFLDDNVRAFQRRSADFRAMR